MALERDLMCIAFLLLLVITTCLTESCQNSLVMVRLVDGTSERNGRVELCWDSQWKAVCDDGWGQEEAITVCRELGYLNNNVRAIAVTSSHFGHAQEIHQLKQWNCESTDTVLAYCSKTIAQSPCSPSQTAGVYCQGTDNCEDGEIRLMNGRTPSLYEGRVEICFNGVWGTICGNDWDSREATVVCRQLGLSMQSLGISVQSSQFYGEGEGLIFLDGIDCGENDTRLADCARLHLTPGMVDDQCTHSKDAGVICNGCDCNDGEIRLNGGQSQTEGIVEICFGGVWGTICDDGWDDSDARVACRQLGYNIGYVLNMNYDGELHKIQHLSCVNCTDQEVALSDCSHEVIGAHTCAQNENAAVMCSEVVNFFPTTLTQPSCFQESYFATSTSERQTSVITSSVMSTFTMTTSPSTPQVTMKLTTRNKIIIGSACSCALLLILVMAVGILIYDMKRRQQKLVTQQHTRERDSNQLQPEVDDDDNIPKEEITILSSRHNDEEVEHNFSNPIYDQVEKRGHIASDTTYSCCAYTEVRPSMVRVEENDDCDNSGHEAEL